eukprot:COSAG01_NODE_814_length_13398_cov_4.254230_10_plen_419_part_00
MIDINFCKEEKETAKAALKRRGISTSLIEDLLTLEDQRKKGQQAIDELRLKRNQLSKIIGQNPANADAIKSEVKALKLDLSVLEEEQDLCEKNLKKLAYRLPNFPDSSVPEGESDADNQVLFSSPVPETLQSAKPHWELGKALGLLDFDRGVKLSGSRFYVLYGQLAKLQRALIYFLLEHLEKAGFMEANVPYMVHQEALYAAGQLPKFAENLYRDYEEDYWWVPTAEVPITGLHLNEILDAESLPRKYCAHTPCFRREKASAGSDVRGIKRGHQFDKVEMYAFSKASESEAIFEQMIATCKAACEALDLPYQVKNLCTGDLGFSATKTQDIEVWSAGCKEWLEVSSVSLCGDFQARRAKVRYKEDKKKVLCHTLNGSCLGIPRTMIAIIENNQQRDGSILVPEPLKKWTGFDKVLKL